MRPVFDRLPEKGYRDNGAVDALTSYYDAKCADVADNIGSFWQRLTLSEAIGEAAEKTTPLAKVPLDAYDLVSYANRTEAGYFLDVTNPTVFSIRLEYPPNERGYLHFVRILDTIQNATVYERGFSAKDFHYFTDIFLPAGSYFVSTNYLKTVPLYYNVEQSNTLMSDDFTLQRSVSLVTSPDGSQHQTMPGYFTPLSIGSQTRQEKRQLDSLDYIAYLLGLVGGSWGKQWDAHAKIKTIKTANLVQTWRGTERALRMVLDNHDLDYDLYGGNSSLRLTFKLDRGKRFGKHNSAVFVRLPLTSQKGGTAYAEAQRAVDNHTAIDSNVKVCYRAFYLGYSTIGDPVFN